MGVSQSFLKKLPPNFPADENFIGLKNVCYTPVSRPMCVRRARCMLYLSPTHFVGGWRVFVCVAVWQHMLCQFSSASFVVLPDASSFFDGLCHTQVQESWYVYECMGGWVGGWVVGVGRWVVRNRALNSHATYIHQYQPCIFFLMCDCVIVC
jgi:hypothetical protein